ncbi:hypothetical protein MUY27_06660 [Mucilaginibacter sp. RS28]|uniref:Uncharacterized protein n=1 Tax=Mucilaginibacter straminoryzae TaxID=2932774 RepID=A0A9X2B894_9SPHI|nr:hypothetical protein [Mucilaginibacter straminoryzae]MCJ8209384.1 hypothetical protein [Mucilaginibacter straminoryzae]
MSKKQAKKKSSKGKSETTQVEPKQDDVTNDLYMDFEEAMKILANPEKGDNSR